MPTVELPSGTPFDVLDEDEASYLRELADAYRDQFAFETASDLADLDRLLGLELIAHRWNGWLATRTDNTGRAIDDILISDRVDKKSQEIRNLKKLLGIDRVTREKESGAGSLNELVQHILDYAQKFGVHREHQLERALELMNELIGLAGLWSRSDEKERKDYACTAEDIVRWILEHGQPEFEEIDLYFQEHEAKFYVTEVINAW